MSEDPQTAPATIPPRSRITSAVPKPRSLRPFSGLGYVGWIRLARAATAALWILYLSTSLGTRGLFEYAGIDFRAFRAAAEVARRDGFARVYDLEALAPEEKRLMQWAAPSVQAHFEVVPVPYLPVFILPFLPLLAVDPLVGLGLWTAGNALLTWLALRWVLPPGEGWVARSAFLSLPVVLTLLFGQVNAWLMIGLAGYLVFLQRQRRFMAGMWLGLLLVKPQIVVLLIVGLLLSRKWRTLSGVFVASLGALAGSVALAGTEGLVRLIDLVLRYPANLATTFPESMMNWRAIGLLLGPVLGTGLAWGMASVGLVSTIALTVAIAVKSARGEGLSTQPLLVLGLYAGSCAVSWHAHVHVAAPLLVPLAWLTARGGWPRWKFDLWVLLPAAIFALGGLTLGAGSAHRIAGILLLTLNTATLVWARSAIAQRSGGTHLRGTAT